MMTPAKTRFVITTALGATLILGAALGLSACGKLGTLEEAPPMFGRDAKSSWSASSGVSVSKNATGGDTATLDDSSASKESERAKPDANAKNKSPNPYAENKKISDAPLEGFGNAASFTNNPNGTASH